GFLGVGCRRVLGGGRIGFGSLVHCCDLRTPEMRVQPRVVTTRRASQLAWVRLPFEVIQLDVGQVPVLEALERQPQAEVGVFEVALYVDALKTAYACPRREGQEAAAARDGGYGARDVRRPVSAVQAFEVVRVLPDTRPVGPHEVESGVLNRVVLVE